MSINKSTTNAIDANTTPTKLSRLVKGSGEDRNLQLAIASHENTLPSALLRLVPIAIDDEVHVAIIENMNASREVLDLIKKTASDEVRKVAHTTRWNRSTRSCSLDFATGRLFTTVDGVEVPATRSKGGWIVPAAATNGHAA